MSNVSPIPVKTGAEGTKTGRVIILSGPSGAGKSTVVRRLAQECTLPLVLSVSATTRPPRVGEVDGREYHFLTNDQFESYRRAGRFLEFKEVFGRGYWYGTLKETVTSGLREGKWVILEIDVQGALSVLRQYPESITIFLHPGSMGELERRLRARGTESDEAIRRRLDVANQEWGLRNHYRHLVVNDSVDNAVKNICQILRQYQDQSVE